MRFSHLFHANGGLCSPSGSFEPDIARVIGKPDRVLIDKSISDPRRPKQRLQMDRARQCASNGGLCNPNGPPGLELASLIGKIYRFLIDILISEAKLKNRRFIPSRGRRDGSNATPHASQLPANLSINRVDRNRVRNPSPPTMLCKGLPPLHDLRSLS